MMVRSRSIVLVALLLLACVPSTTADVHGPEIHFDQDDGLVQSSGQVTLSGQANVPLNEITWTVIDVTTGDVIASGDFLDTVAPEQEGTWTWTHNISVPSSGCSCRFVVVQGTYSAELVLTSAHQGPGPRSGLMPRWQVQRNLNLNRWVRTKCRALSC